MVQYGSRVAHEFRLGEHRTVDEVLQAVADIRQRGGEETRTALAINMARCGADLARRVRVTCTKCVSACRRLLKGTGVQAWRPRRRSQSFGGDHGRRIS